MFPFPFTCLLLLACLQTRSWATHTRESAWNGHFDKLAASPRPFTPFYVPPGSVAYDLSSRSTSLAGSWHGESSPDCFNRTALTTLSKNATATIHFTGTAIELYGSIGPHFGAADVHLDGNNIKSFSAASHTKSSIRRLSWIRA